MLPSEMEETVAITRAYAKTLGETNRGSAEERRRGMQPHSPCSILRLSASPRFRDWNGLISGDRWQARTYTACNNSICAM